MKTLFSTIILCFLLTNIYAQEYITKTDSITNTTTAQTQTSSTSTTDDRNLICVGYCIAGYSAIGVDYEIRLHDYFGLHFGAGLSGFGAGVNILFKPTTNSPYLDLCFKDGGFGQLQTLGIDFGVKIVFNKAKSDAGLLLKAGLGNVIKMSDSIKENYVDDLEDDAPNALYSFGIGISW